MKNLYIKSLMILMFAITVICFSIGKDAKQLNRVGDAAIFEQVIENINLGKGAVSSVFANTQNYIDRGYAFLPADVIAKTKLEPPEKAEKNMLEFHAYYILFLLAPLVDLVPSSLVLTTVQSISFFGLLLVAGIFVFKETKNLIASILIVLFIFLNPNWTGGIDGQFYPDRLFVLVGFMLCCLIYQGTSIWRILLVAIAAGIINERAALIGGVILLGMPFLRRSDGFDFRLGWICFCVGIILLTYAYIQKNYVLTNVYYNSGFLPQDFSDLFARIQLDGFARNIGILFLNNVLLIGLSLAAPRLALITFIVMLPNIVGNVGGAEKTGWATHYHSYYFSMLSFSAAVGMSNIYNNFVKKDLNQFITASGLTAISVLGSILILQYTTVTAATGMSPFSTIEAAAENLNNRLKGNPTGYEIRSEIVAKFKEGSRVSTGEFGMALLHGHVELSFFPVGVENSDYALVPCSIIIDEEISSNAALYSKDWFRLKGFDIESIGKIPSISYCILKKIDSPG